MTGAWVRLWESSDDRHVAFLFYTFTIRATLRTTTYPLRPLVVPQNSAPLRISQLLSGSSGG